MYSQFFVANLRDCGVLGKDVIDTFFRLVIQAGQPTTGEPLVTVDGIIFAHVRRNSLFFVLTAIDQPSATLAPSFAIELLTRLVTVVRDFCGDVAEETLRENAVLVHEILDDFFDLGLPQTTTTDSLATLVKTAAVEGKNQFSTAASGGNVLESGGASSKGSLEQAIERVTQNVIEKFGGPQQNVASASRANRSVQKADQTDATEEIFVDLIERMAAIFNMKGELVSCDVTGSILVKNLLRGGLTPPNVFISLNTDVFVNPETGEFEDCNFHSCVRTENFARDRTITVMPPRGEIVAMSYRAHKIDALPFVLTPSINQVSPIKFAVNCRVIADFAPEISAVNLRLTIPVPRNTQSVFCEATMGHCEYRKEEAAIICIVPRIHGNEEVDVRTNVSLDKQTPGARRMFGPADLSFEVSNWTATHIRVVNINVEDRGHPVECNKWSRSLTVSQSYARRLF